MLENILDSLIQDHNLLSWYTRGGSKFTQVCLRFDTAAMSEDTAETVMYRKVSQRRIERETNRAKQWRDTQKSMPEDILDQSCGSSMTKDMDIQTDIEASAMAHMAVPHIDTLPTDSSIGNNTTADAADQITEVTTGINAKEVNISTVGVGQQTDASTCTHVDAVDQGCETEESLIFRGIGVRCNICNYSCNIHGNRWKRCTRCDDYDICYDCRRYHARHKAYVHEFVYPDDPDYGYCDSCGHSFENTSEYLFQCKACEDYVLCGKCLREGMHPQHRPDMIKMPVGTYLDLESCNGDG